MNYEIERRWWFPFVVEVWKDAWEIEDWKKGKGMFQIRVATFFRRSTAERWVAWKRQRERAA